MWRPSAAPYRLVSAQNSDAGGDDGIDTADVSAVVVVVDGVA